MENEKASTEVKLGPPYGSPLWYERFFTLMDRITIDKIDTSFLKTNNVVSSGNEYKFINGLKFLGLLDANGEATEKLKALNVIGVEKYSELKPILEEKYSLLIKSVDLSKAMPDDIPNALIEKYGMSVSTAKQGASIFVYLADKAGIALSDKLNIPTPSEQTKRRKKIIKKGRKMDDVSKDAEGVENDVFDDLNKHKITWGEDILIILKKNDVASAETAKMLIDLYINKIKMDDE